MLAQVPHLMADVVAEPLSPKRTASGSNTTDRTTILQSPQLPDHLDNMEVLISRIPGVQVQVYSTVLT